MPPVIVENMQCRLSGCRNYPTGSSFLCRRHYNRCACCHRQGQIDERGEHFCFEHAPCQMVGCESTEGSRRVFCADHFEICTTENCCQLAVANFHTEPRCIDHIPCKKNDCHQYTSYLTSNDSNPSPYCATHSCTIANCCGLAIYVFFEDGFQRQLCGQHFQQRRCLETSCKLLRTTADAQLPYCEAHIRCALDDCQCQRRPGSKFCSAHTCHQEGCSRPTPHDAPYCRRHECRGYLDVMKTIHCPIVRQTFDRQGADFCKLHTCQISIWYRTVSCVNDNQNRTYCNEHRCLVADCNEPRAIDPLALKESWDMLCCRRKLLACDES